MNSVAELDAKRSFSKRFKIYYRLGHADGILIEKVQEEMIIKHHIILIYTHCTPCRYQRSYNKVFEKLYFEDNSESLSSIIRRIEKR